MPNALRRANAHNLTRERLDEIGEYLDNGTLPRRVRELHTSGQYRFKNNYKGWRVRGTEILTDTGLIVIAKEDIEDKLKEIYNDPKTGRKNVEAMYSVITNRYANITKGDISDFLNKQTSYQMTKKQARSRVSRPILCSEPRERYQIDFIVYKQHSRQNGGYKYIFVCIDCFSKYVMVFPTKRRTMSSIIEAIDYCISQMNKPTIIQGDNEFYKQALISHLQEKYDIKFIPSSPYTPSTNGMVERTNRTIKNILNLFFDERGNNKWIDILPEVISNINKAPIRSLLGNTPLKVHSLGESIRDQTLLKKIWENQRDDKVKMLERYNIDDTLEKIEKGDTVRLQIEKVLKAKGTFIKRDKLRWSKNIYTVEEIFNTEFNTQMFLLSNNKTYSRSQILKVQRPDEDPSTELDEPEEELEISTIEDDVSTVEGEE